MRPFTKAVRRAYLSAYYGAHVGLVVPTHHVRRVKEYLEDLGMRCGDGDLFIFTPTFPGKIRLFTEDSSACGLSPTMVIIDEVPE